MVKKALYVEHSSHSYNTDVYEMVWNKSRFSKGENEKWHVPQGTDKKEWRVYGLSLLSLQKWIANDTA